MELGRSKKPILLFKSNNRITVNSHSSDLSALGPVLSLSSGLTFDNKMLKEKYIFLT